MIPVWIFFATILIDGFKSSVSLIHIYRLIVIDFKAIENVISYTNNYNNVYVYKEITNKLYAKSKDEDSPKKYTKSNLPSKICLCCGRKMEWRKSWAKNWDEVKYCSDKCRMNKTK